MVRQLHQKGHQQDLQGHPPSSCYPALLPNKPAAAERVQNGSRARRPRQQRSSGAAARPPGLLTSYAATLALMLLGGGSWLPRAAALNFAADHANYRPAPLGDNSWYYGSATWYNFRNGDCGFSQDFLNMIYTAAVPLPRFSDTKMVSVPPFLGAACGQCFAIRCANIARYAGLIYCRPGNPEIIVTVADYDVPKSPSWPLNHFDLSVPGFERIADPKAGIINVEWRRIPCGHKHAAWKLAPDSNPWYSDIVIEAVPGTGNVVKVFVLDGRSWKAARHMWGSRWSYPGKALPTSKIAAVLAENKGMIYPVHDHN